MLAYCMDEVSLLRQACCAFRNLFFKLVKLDPFRQAVTTSSICNNVFPTMFLKLDSVYIIPEGATVWGIESLLRLFNGWRIFVGHVTMLLKSVMGGNFIWLEWKVMGNLKVFEYLRCYWHWYFCTPNWHKPINNTDETLQNRNGETQATLQKIEYAGYKVISIWGCEFTKLLRENPGLENGLCTQTYVKNSPINIRVIRG